MVLAPLVAVAVMWPKGWVYSEATWTDPNGGGKVVAQSLLIAHPWWTKGWYGPIGRTAQTGNALFAPPPGMRSVQMNVALWRCDSAALWKSRSVGRGSLGFGIPGPAVPAIAGEDEWTDTVRRYTRAAAGVTGIDSAPMGGLSLRARNVITAVTGVAPPLPAPRVARPLPSEVPAASSAQAAPAPIVPVSAKPLSTPPPNAAGSR